MITNSVLNGEFINYGNKRNETEAIRHLQCSLYQQFKASKVKGHRTQQLLSKRAVSSLTQQNDEIFMFSDRVTRLINNCGSTSQFFTTFFFLPNASNNALRSSERTFPFLFESLGSIGCFPNTLQKYTNNILRAMHINSLPLTTWLLLFDFSKLHCRTSHNQQKIFYIAKSFKSNCQYAPVQLKVRLVTFLCFKIRFLFSQSLPGFASLLSQEIRMAAVTFQLNAKSAADACANLALNLK